MAVSIAFLRRNDVVVFLNCYGANSRLSYGGIKCHRQANYTTKALQSCTAIIIGIIWNCFY